VTSNVAGTGISISGATGAVTITNSGVTSITAGSGISISGATGGVTITNTITNNNQLTNGAGYITSAGSISGNAATATNATAAANISLTGIASVNVNNGSSAVYRTESGTGAALAYAPVLHLGGGDTMWQAQGTYGTSGNGTLYFRQGYSGSWGNWLTMLSSANYNSYSPTLTGTGASGTWSINVTGTAGSLSSMNISQFTNNSGYITGLSFDGLSSKTGGSGTYQTSGDFRAPIFYDSANTGYYLDPASTSNLNSITYPGSFTYNGSAGSYALNLATNDGYASMRVISNNMGSSPFNDGMYIGYGNASSGVTRIFGGGSTGGALIKYATYSEEANSFRAPIFYDSNDTGYYLDPSGGALRLYRSPSYSGGFSVSDTGGYLTYRITTNNHADGWEWQFTTQLPESSTWTKKFWFNYGSGNGFAESSWRAPIFYDSDNTGYYLNPASTSNLSTLSVATLYNPTNGSGYYFTNGSWGWRHQTPYGYIEFGPANGSYAHIYTNMGNFYFNVDTLYANGNIMLTAANYNSYSPTLTGGNASGTWGINVTGTAGSETLNTVTSRGATTSNAITVGLLIAQGPGGNYNENVRLPGSTAVISFNTSGATGAGSYNIVSQTDFQIRNAGGSQVFIMDQSGNLTMAGSMRTPIFYDSNNTGYYLDPASTSSLNALTMAGSITTPTGTSIYIGNQNVSTSARLIINWHTDSDYNYVIGKRAGSWTQPMDIAFYTGIKYHAHQTYGGHKFYVTGYDSTEAFSIGAGDNNVRVGYNLYSPIMYDSNNTGYYIDPSSNSNTNSMRAGEFRGNANVGGTGEATWHPAGAYVGGTMWQYGAMYKNNTDIYDISIGYANSSFRAPIFYDSDNTGYYLNPAGASYLYSLQLAGGAYFRPNTWIQMDGGYGIYWPNNNGAHIYANDISYGSVRIDGTRNGWRGINFGGAVTLMMNDNETGFYKDGSGWQWRWYQGQIYCHRGTYGGGTSYTVIDEGNISSYTAGNVNSISSAVGGSYTWTNVNYFRTNQGGYCGSLDSGRMQAYSDSNNSAFFSFHKGGYYAVNMGLDADNVIRIGGWSASANRWQLDMSGNNWAATSFRSTYFYDQNDTGYYGAFSGTSRMSRINANYLYAYNWVYSEGNICAYYSDERLKTKTGNIENALDKIKQLNGFYYVNNDLAKSFGYTEEKTQVGLSAQEVQSVLPEVVTRAPFDTEFDENQNPIGSKSGENYLTISYDKLVPLLIEAIKEQQQQIDELKTLLNK
jgi:hypothetical protein